MRIGNLIAKDEQSLSDIEIREIRRLIEFDEQFKITKVEQSNNPLFGTYFYFKVKISKSEFRNDQKDTLKFVLDNNGYIKGYFNVTKEIAGHLKTDEEREIGKISDEIDWHGVQYTRTFHILDLKSRKYKEKHWECASLAELLGDDDLHEYAYDTDLNNLQISKIARKFSEIYCNNN